MCLVAGVEMVVTGFQCAGYGRKEICVTVVHKLRCSWWCGSYREGVAV